MSDFGPAALLALALALVSAAPAAAQTAEEKTYEFLRRQGRLLFEYGKFDEAADALQSACRDPKGASDATCHRDLAVTAERAGRIGVAIDAWRAAVVHGDAEASPELQRLESAYGLARIQIPPGRTLPTLPFALAHQGMLIDPALKAQLAAVVGALAAEGLAGLELWLPAGPYTLAGAAIEVPPGGSVEVTLGRDVVPWRPRSFGMAGDTPALALGGPTELSVSLAIGVAGVPGGGLGVGPARIGVDVRLGRHLGPVRIVVGGRLSGTATRSLSDATLTDRRATALEAVAIADLGLDLRLGARMFLTPHLGIEAGTLGSLMVPCVTEHIASLTVSRGECRLSAVAVGGLAGLDALLVPGGEPGRAAIRLGLAAEFLGAGFVAAPGDLLKGAEVTLVRSARWRFARLGGVVDVGLALRF